MKKTGIVLLAIFLLCCATAAGAAPAHININKIPAFAEKVFFEKFFKKTERPQLEQGLYAIHDDASFEANTHIVHMRPYNNPSLEFDTHIPNTWSMDDLTKNQTLNVDQSIIGDLENARSEMVSIYRLNSTVSTQHLKYEITAKNWLKHYLLKNGYALEGDVQEDSPFLATAYYTSISDQKSVFTYISARVSGSIAFIVRFEAPLPLKAHVAYLQKKLVDTTLMSYPSDGTVESQRIFTLADAMKFSYPASWSTTKPDFKDMDRLSVQLQTKNSSGSIDGYIHLYAIRRIPATNLMKEVEEIKTHFKEYLSINLVSLVSSSAIEAPNKRFLFSRYEVYKAAYQKDGHSDPEVRLAVLGDKDWYVLIYMITPKEQDNLFTWGRNVRSLDLLLKSLR